jgi:RNA polymerase sigma-70 factor, ECF subfamily
MQQEDSGMQSTNAGIDAGENVEIQSSGTASEAFGEVLSNNLPSLYRGAYRLLGNTADAEDAVQDALLAAYTHLEQFRGQAKMSTWLAAIVHNAARMQLRSRLRHVHVSFNEPIGEEEHCIWQGLADHRPSPEDECRDSELGTRMAGFQSQLTPSLRKAYQLRHVDGLSIRETARILGVPHGTVKARTARACKKIKDLMRRALKPRSRNLTRAAAVRQSLARI